MADEIPDAKDQTPEDPEAVLSPLEIATSQLLNPSKARSLRDNNSRDSTSISTAQPDVHTESQSLDVTMGGGEIAVTGLRARERENDSDVPPEIPEGPEDRWKAILPRAWMFRYCVALKTLGVVALACREANVSRQTVAVWRGKCQEFELCCSEAEADSVDAVEAALRITATVGDPEPVFQQGKRVGTRRRKDARAADILLRAKRPEEYRPDYQGAPQTQTLILASPEQVADVVRNLGPVLARHAPKKVDGRVIEAVEQKPAAEI